MTEKKQNQDRVEDEELEQRDDGERIEKEIRELKRSEPADGGPGKSFPGDPSAGATGPGGSS